MAEVGRKVLKFKITIDCPGPLIWRSILVPEDYTFFDLHVAIQSAMGWKDCHQHHFVILNPVLGKYLSIGVPKIECCGGKSHSTFVQCRDRRFCGKILRVLHPFANTNFKATYSYGDWTFYVDLEKILPAKDRENYPQCIDGKNASPPEECGSIESYKNLLKIIANPRHEEYQEKIDWLRNLNWLNGYFDPMKFDPETVVFADPEERWSLVSVSHTPEIHSECHIIRPPFD